MYRILKRTLRASVFAVVLAGVLVPSLELSPDDVNTDELLPPFIRIFMQMFVVRHPAV